MNKIYVLPQDELGEEIYQRIHQLIKENRCAWATIGAIFGLVSGTFSIILGAVLWIIVQFLSPGEPRSFLNVLDTVVFVLPLPLLGLAAYCLDLLEKMAPIIPLMDKSQPADSESRRRLRPHRPHQN
jgi:hypothetical protein